MSLINSTKKANVTKYVSMSIPTNINNSLILSKVLSLIVRYNTHSLL